MKALSVRSQYTMDMFMGIQTYEERTWQTDYRGDLLICASSRKDPGCVSGYAYFVVELLDIVLSDDEVMNGSGNIVHPYRWIIGKPRAIQPIPVKGKLHLFDVDDALIHYIPDGDLGSYPVAEDAELFRDAFRKTYLDPLILAQDRATSPGSPDPSRPLLRKKGSDIPPIAPEDDIALIDLIDVMCFLDQNPPVTRQYNAGRDDPGIERLIYGTPKAAAVAWYVDKYRMVVQNHGNRVLNEDEEPGAYGFYMRWLSEYGLLWLAEVLGEKPEKLMEAMDAALTAGQDCVDDRCNAFRKVIPYERIVQLYDTPGGWRIDDELKGLITINKEDGTPYVTEGMDRQFEQALDKQGIFID